MLMTTESPTSASIDCNGGTIAGTSDLLYNGNWDKWDGFACESPSITNFSGNIIVDFNSIITQIQ